MDQNEIDEFKKKEKIFMEYFTLKRNLIVDIYTYYFINTIYYSFSLKKRKILFTNIFSTYQRLHP